MKTFEYGERPPSSFIVDINTLDSDLTSYHSCLQDILPMVARATLNIYREQRALAAAAGRRRRPRHTVPTEDVIIRTGHADGSVNYQLLDRTGKLQTRLGQSVVAAIQDGGIGADFSLYTQLRDMRRVATPQPTVITSDGLVMQDGNRTVMTETYAGAESHPNVLQKPSYPLLRAGFTALRTRSLVYQSNGMPRLLDGDSEAHTVFGATVAEGFVPLVTVLGPDHPVITKLLEQTAEWDSLQSWPPLDGNKTI